MAVHIQRLICNVTVHAPPSSSATAGPPLMTSRESLPMPSASPPAVLQRTLEAGGGTANESSTEVSTGSSPAGAVDTRKLADKVYRLMLEDLKIARERE